MKRYELSAAQWRKVEGFLPRRKGATSEAAQETRRIVNGIMWVLRSGTLRSFRYRKLLNECVGPKL